VVGKPTQCPANGLIDLRPISRKIYNFFVVTGLKLVETKYPAYLVKSFNGGTDANQAFY
jgi:hypothetical protein